MELEALDKKLLTKIQFDFPLNLTPYQSLAEMVGTTEADVIARLGRLREFKVIRQISAIFDTRNLGYTSALVAMKIPAEQLSAGARGGPGFPGAHPKQKGGGDLHPLVHDCGPPGARSERDGEDRSGRSGGRLDAD